MIHLPESLPCVANEDPKKRMLLHSRLGGIPREWRLGVRRSTNKQTALGLWVRHKRLSWRTQKRVNVAYLSLSLVCPLGVPSEEHF